MDNDHFLSVSATKKERTFQSRSTFRAVSGMPSTERKGFPSYGLFMDRSLTAGGVSLPHRIVPTAASKQKSTSKEERHNEGYTFGPVLLCNRGRQIVHLRLPAKGPTWGEKEVGTGTELGTLEQGHKQRLVAMLCSSRRASTINTNTRPWSQQNATVGRITPRPFRLSRSFNS